MSNKGGNDLSDFSMLELFRTEVEDRVAVLSDGLLALERDPNATGGIEPLMRATWLSRFPKRPMVNTGTIM